jgi:hypothetical protein
VRLNPILGLFALGSMWTAAILVAAAAWQDRKSLKNLIDRFNPLDLREGALGMGSIRGKVDARGPDRIFAVHEINQLGRALDAEQPAIGFRDVSASSRCLGGFVTAAGIWVRIPAADSRVSVWTPREAREQAAACSDAFTFEAAHLGAKSAKGTRRTVTTALRAGDAIFIAGEVQLQDRKLVVKAPANQNLILASFDPRGNLTRQARVITLFILAELLACALCTALALWSPAFGTVSTLGAVLCLAFFLGVTPIGVELHDWSQPPDGAPLHGEWTYALKEQAQPEQVVAPT